MSNRLGKLFEPVKIGAMEVKNRLVLCPMGLGYCSVTGEVNQRLIDYYTERAKGGVGLIILEGTCIEGNLGMLGLVPRTIIDRDQFIAGLNDLVESVHRYGAKIAIQFQHGGSRATLDPGKQPVSASAFPIRPGVNARALAIEEVEALEECYAEAARRAKAAGFDAIDINCGCGTLIAQFLSPFANKRTDKYGGDLDGRMRFITGIIGRVQQRVGKDYPIIIDHPADEIVDGGIRMDESRVIAQRLEKLGVVAFRMHSSILDPRFVHWVFPPAAMPRGFQVEYAAETRKVLERAKVMVGRQIQDLDYASSIIEEGKADLIVLGRPLIADPELPNKAIEGRQDEIRRCLRCLRCAGNYLGKQAARCTINPALGNEREARITPAAKAKKVLVVGGGPGGMEAARVAALRGHAVALYEKADRLGGQLNLAGVPPYKDEMQSLIQYYANQLRKLWVRVELGAEVTRKLVREERPDVVILATGAAPLIPGIPGVEKPIVTTAWDILGGRAKVGEKVIVIGGGQVGLETAEHLAGKGKKVTVVEMLPDAGIDIDLMTRTVLLKRLAEYGVGILTSTKVKEITDTGLVATDKNNKEQSLEGGTVVLAAGATPNKKLEELKKEGDWEVYSIGDCVSPRKALEAIHEGYWVSSRI